MNGAPLTRRAHAEANRLGYERCKMLALGTPVWLRLDDGTEVERHTSSAVWETGSGHWLIAVAGKSGGWDCARVRPRP